MIPLLVSLVAAQGAAQGPCEGWMTEQFWRTADPPTVRECLAAGSSVDDRTLSWNVTSLHLAARYTDDPEVISVLVEAGADLEASSRPAFRTPLHQAARFNENPEVIRAFLEHGADVYAVNHVGRTPLHLAALFNDNPAVVEELARVSHVNATTHDGRTPLHDAARRLPDSGLTGLPNPGVAEVLIRQGADLSAKALGATPAGWAEDRRVADMIREEASRRAAIRERFLRDIATSVAVGSLVLGVLGYLMARRGRARSRLSS